MKLAFSFDSDKLVQAALETGAAPLAVEEGVSLAEFWISKGVVQEKRIRAVECGFVWWAEEKTAIVGVQDLLTDEEGVVGNEWKTTKEATRWWNEDKWLESITEGSQIAIYALALKYGTYYASDGTVLTPNVDSPRIRVRAISKSEPPVLWPRSDKESIVKFSPERLEATRQALLAKADSIRAMRKRVGVWQVPGIWCENKFRRVCEYYDDCLHQRPCETKVGLDVNDPAYRLAVPHVDRIDNDLVILSASAYAKACECPEAYRRSLVQVGDGSHALDTGSVFHAVVASSYQQLKEYQESFQKENSEPEKLSTGQISLDSEG